MALWDLKGKALGVPVYQSLGGQSRDYVECYSTGFRAPGTPKDVAKVCVDAGFRAYLISTDTGVGKDGAWCIDFHTELDMPDAVALANMIEPLRPYFVEDLVRGENPGIYRALRPQVKVTIAAGEQFGPKWDWNELIEQHLTDYARATIPNVGGITLRGAGPALYGSDFRSGDGALPGGVFRPGVDGVGDGRYAAVALFEPEL